MNETTAAAEDAPIGTATRVPPEEGETGDAFDGDAENAPAPTATRAP